MRKFFIVTALGLSGLGALAGVPPASAGQTCKTVCDQWAPDGNRRCFSAHVVCTKVSTVSSSGGGAPKTVQQRKNQRQN